jgi:hypothetical protein
MPASEPPAAHWPEVVLQVKPEGQFALEVHFAEHCWVAALQMKPVLLIAQSASVEQVQKLAAEFWIFAHVFWSDEQSEAPLHVATHVLSTG